MDPKKLLIISVVIGAVAVVMLQFRTRGDAEEKVTVFRATDSLNAGDTLGGSYETVEKPLSWYQMMEGEVPTGIHENLVATTPLVRSINPGETVTFDHLSKAADKGLPALISSGQRAIAISVSGPQAVGYLVRPGDYVDVLGTVPDGTNENMFAKYILQAKKVLAVDQQYRLQDSAFASRSTYSTVTLEVTPEEAQKVEILRGLVQNGFSIALRAPDDKKITASTANISIASPEFDAIGNQ